MVDYPALSNFVEEVGMGVERTKSNGHQIDMGIVEVLQTLKDIQIENGNILQSLEQQNQINRQVMQNLVQLQNHMQHVSSIVRREVME